MCCGNNGWGGGNGCGCLWIILIIIILCCCCGGTVNCDTSELGGARFSFSWPLWHNIPQFTSA